MTFDLGTASLEAIRPTLEELLAVEMRERESSYFGGTYFKVGGPGAEEEIYLHHDPDLDDEGRCYLRIDKSDRDPQALEQQLIASLGQAQRLP